MGELDPAFEQQLAELSDADWRSLSARVRPPTSSEQLRELAGKHLSGDQVETLMAITDPKRFADENGNIDETKVQQLTGALFGASGPPQQQPATTPKSPQWGQTSAAGGPSKSAGDDGRAALAKRHGVKNDSPQFDQGIRAGDSARAALERRYGKATQ